MKKTWTGLAIGADWLTLGADGLALGAEGSTLGVEHFKHEKTVTEGRFYDFQ